MHTPEGFSELLLLLLIAAGAAAFFRRMELPAVLGYLAVGPSALALVHDTEAIRALAELGVVLLLLLGMPGGDVAGRVRAIRHDRYALLRALYPGATDAAPDARTLRGIAIPGDARTVGDPIGRLQAGDANTPVVALVRRGRRIDAPGPDTVVALDRAEAELVRR